MNLLILHGFILYLIVQMNIIDFAKNEEGTEKNKMFDATVALFKKLWEQYASKDDGLYIGNKTY